MHSKNTLLLCFVLFLLCITTVAPVKAAGELDPSFKTFLANNVGGVTETVIQPDGKVLIFGVFEVIGTQVKPFITRLNADGTLDTSFDPPILYRQYSYNYSGQTPVKFVQLQSDGKILIAGLFGFQQRLTGLIRLNPDGSPDNAFNNSPDVSSIFDARGLDVFPDDKIIVTGTKNGSVLNIVLNADGTTNRQASAPVEPQKLYVQPDGRILGFYNSERLYRLNQDLSVDSGFQPEGKSYYGADTQPDGKVVAFGYFNGTSEGYDSLIRLNTDGTIDQTFGTTRPSRPDGNVNSIRILPDGKILIGGMFTRINGITSNGIARLNSDGSLDTSFNSAIPPVNNTPVNDIKITPDGKIFACYYAQIYKLNSDGSLDNTFSAERGRSPQAGEALAIQADGKILVSGDFSNIGGINKRGIARLNTDGTLDTSFNIINPGQGDLGAYVIKIQPDGKIIVGASTAAYRFDANGVFELQFPGISTIYAAAIAPDGKIYFSGPQGLKSYAPNGTLINGNLSPNDNVYEMVAQPDSKIVFATNLGVIKRINADGTIDSGFQSMPRLINGAIYSLSVQPDGKVLFSGAFTHVNNDSNRKFLARLNTNGSVDTSFNPVMPSTVYTTLVQPNGKILVHPVATDGYAYYGSLFRVEPNGARDDSFNTVTTDNVITGLGQQNDGKILITGRISRVNGIPKIGIARLLNAQAKTAFDFDGDGKSDIGIFRPSTGAWWINASSTNITTAAAFGSSNDKLIPADYTGDGKTDIAFYRPATSEWFILRSSDNTYYGFPFGASGDIPAPGDYDGDGKADAAVFRPSNGVWYIMRSSDNAITSFQFGVLGDQPVVADYDGDGKADVAITRINNGAREWWIAKSGGGVYSVTFGLVEDKTVSGDYTGDGKADVAFFRPSTGYWYIIRSEDNYSYYGFPFGSSPDVPAPGDYDGDGKTDPAVFRSSNASWYLQRSTAGFIGIAFGNASDQPIPNAFVR